METKDELQVMDHLTIPTTTTSGTSFSQLLLGDDDNDHNPLGLDVDQTFSTSLFSLHNTPKMLCFGDYQNEIHETTTNVILTPQKSIITSSDSSSASSCNHQTNTGFNSLTTTKSNSLQKKRNGSGGQELGTKAGVGGQKGPKKTKGDNPTSTGHAKPKKEKLGERIAALQQLVSPFGKTDTASVLHEATGYIRFLHDQVQVLCSPYLQPSQVQFQNHPGDGDNNVNVNVNEIEEVGEEVKNDLRSRGLCLIPVGCTLHVASSNGADFWSPASIGNNVSSSTITTKQ